MSKANELFDADFSVFKHEDSGLEAVRTLSYSIPAELQGHLDLVHPTVTFPNPNGHLPVFKTPVKGKRGFQNFTARSVPSECSDYITPACLQALYNIPTDAATQSSNQLAVTGFIDQFANKADLKVRSTSALPRYTSELTQRCGLDLPDEAPHGRLVLDDVHPPDPRWRLQLPERQPGRCRGCK